MLEVRKTAEFTKWMASLRDIRGRAKIVARIDRLAMGHAGDVKPIGDGLSELRIHFGPGYRVYFARRGDVLIVLLSGGDESSQGRDIRAARKLAAEY